MKTKKAVLKDITPKPTTKVKGGGTSGSNYCLPNDNITLVRAAKPPVTKDLPPKNPTTIKGGRLPSP